MIIFPLTHKFFHRTIKTHNRHDIVSIDHIPHKGFKLGHNHVKEFRHIVYYDIKLIAFKLTQL